MTDLHKRLEQLKRQLAECELIRDLVTDKDKRELFARFADHYKALIALVEKALADGQTDDFLHSKEEDQQ